MRGYLQFYEHRAIKSSLVSLSSCDAQIPTVELLDELEALTAEVLL